MWAKPTPYEIVLAKTCLDAVYNRVLFILLCIYIYLWNLKVHVRGWQGESKLLRQTTTRNRRIYNAMKNKMQSYGARWGGVEKQKMVC